MFEEVHKYEIFDGCDIDGSKQGIDMVRGQKPIAGLYHVVIEIITINKKNQVLVTQRHKRKNYPLFWEITGGAVLKGESIIEGAKRELMEETGIIGSLFTPLYETVENDRLYRGLLTTVGLPEITLQIDETIDYQWIDACDFVAFMNRDDFIPSARKRMLQAWYVIEPILFKDDPCL